MLVYGRQHISLAVTYCVVLLHVGLRSSFVIFFYQSLFRPQFLFTVVRLLAGPSQDSRAAGQKTPR